jgi:hypothetical protein
MDPEYAKYLNFTKKIQKAKSTRRADAARADVSRIPRARDARATPARRPRVARTPRHNPLARFRFASRARTLLPLLSRIRR